MELKEGMLVRKRGHDHAHTVTKINGDGTFWIDTTEPRALVTYGAYHLVDAYVPPSALEVTQHKWAEADVAGYVNIEDLDWDL